MSAPIQLLIAEDSDDDAVLIVDGLRRAGLTLEYQRVETLAAASAALAAAPPPDVLICDYNLPGFGAGEVLDLLHERGLDVPFILVSGQIGEEAAAALMRAGADDFFLKDRLTRLAPAIARALGEAEVRRQRRSGEVALRESEERFRLLAEYAQDIIFRCRLVPHASLEYLSPSVAAITGYQPDELYGDPARFFATVVPEDQHLLEQSWRYPGGDLLLTRWHRRNGELAWMEQRAAGIIGPDGTVVAVQGVLRDVTARVVAEREHTALEAQLHQAQRLESLGQLAGGVAHDFNNLLAVILSYTGLITEDVAAASVGDTSGRWAAIGEDLGRVQHAAGRAAALTQQLLAFGRREIVRPCPLDLNVSVFDVGKLLDRTIGNHVTVIADPAEDLWAVCADPGQIEQVLLNLAVNARDAIPISGGTLTISTRNVVITDAMAVTLPGLAGGQHVQLRVSDTGSGIPPEVAEHIFEPFFTTKAKGCGTGLGLATVYGIVKQAGGHIGIEPDRPQGTVFTILLPRTHLAPTVVIEALTVDPPA